jgi:hypothetical protein
LRIQDAVLGLNGPRTATKTGIECSQEVRRHARVGIHHDNGIRERIAKDRVEGVLQRVPLSTAILVATLEHRGAGFARKTRGIVTAIVGHDEHTPAIRRVFHGDKRTDGFGDSRRFVVGGNNDVEFREFDGGGQRVAASRNRTPGQEGKHGEIRRPKKHRYCKDDERRAQ